MPDVTFAGGIFTRIHDAMVDSSIDFDRFDPNAYSAEDIARARLAWSIRVQTEFRSIQVMTRFTQEVLGAGDPLDVYAGAVDAIRDEIRHTTLCVQMLRALGGRPVLPEPLAEPTSAEYLAIPMAQRSTATALSMLAISETLSTGFLRDLHARCTDPTVHAVLDATLADEDAHEAYGWAYLDASLQRCEGGVDFFRLVVARTLRPLATSYDPIVESMPADRRHLDAHPDITLAPLGLLSPEREALVFQQTLRTQVLPRLARLGLAEI